MELYILIGAVVALVVLEIFLIFRGRRRGISKKDKALIVKEWQSAREKLGREPKHALMEADKLLDFALKKKGYEGSMADKLKKAEKLFSHIDAVWDAHKLRNRAVHEVGFVVHEQQAAKAISAIKQALWDLGVKI